MQKQAPPLADPPDEPTPPKAARNWRPVLQLLGAYLVGAWTLLQFLEWILNRNQVSPYWVDLFIWIFIGLLPSVILYLLHKERIDQFRIKAKEKVFFSSNLLFLFLALFFGFRSTDMGATTTDIQYVTADGRLQKNTIVKSEFRKSLVVFNFTDSAIDSSELWLRTGIPKLLAIDVRQDKAVNVEPFFEDYSTVSKIRTAQYGDFFVDGTYTVTGGNYTLTPAIYAAKNGKLLASTSFTGPDLLAILDSISIYIRQESGLNEELLNAATDLPLREYTSSSLPALREFCEGTLAGLERAVALDSSFALASLELADRLFAFDLSELDAKIQLDRAYRHRDKLPYDLQYAVLSSRYLVYGDLEAAKETLRLQLEIDPESDALNRRMADVYRLDEDFEQMLAFARQWYQRNFNYSSIEVYGDALLFNAETDQLLRAAKPLLLLDPNAEGILRYTFAAQLINRNWEAALDILKKIQLSYPDFDTQLKQFETSLRYQRDHGYHPDQFAAFLGTYRHFNSGRTIAFITNPQNSLLMGQAPNGSSVFFPLAEQELVNFDDWSFTESIELVSDSSGAPYGIEFTWIRGDVPIIDHPFYWKIDSRIEAAEAALMSRDYAAAEPAYRVAIETHPNHYFLRDGMAHVRYATTKTAAELLDQYHSVAGTYGDRRFWVEDGRLFYKRASSGNSFNSTMELYPISETRYCNFLRQQFQLEFQYQNGQSVASYSFLYDREAQAWKQNPNESDLIRKQE